MLQKHNFLEMEQERNLLRITRKAAALFSFFCFILAHLFDFETTFTEKPGGFFFLFCMIDTEQFGLFIPHFPGSG